MYLAIDNSSAEKITLHYRRQARSYWRDFSLTGEGSVLRSIEVLLCDLKASPRDLLGVAVVFGHGRWTAIRVAVVAANALAYTLGIPVVAAAAGSDSEMDKVWVRLESQPVGRYILPRYSGEARVGSVKS